MSDFKVHQIQFSHRLRPPPSLGAYSAPPRTKNAPKILSTVALTRTPEQWGIELTALTRAPTRWTEGSLSPSQEPNPGSALRALSSRLAPGMLISFRRHL